MSAPPLLHMHICVHRRLPTLSLTLFARMKSAGTISASEPTQAVKDALHEGLASELLCLEVERLTGPKGRVKGHQSSAERKRNIRARGSARSLSEACEDDVVRRAFARGEGQSCFFSPNNITWKQQDFDVSPGRRVLINSISITWENESITEMWVCAGEKPFGVGCTD